MAVDPNITELGVQLVEVGARNTVAALTDRIRAVKARRQDQETINVLEEIINDLIGDRNELIQIAHGYEQVLGAQRISEAEISYITQSIIPIVKTLMSASDDVDSDSAEEMIALLEPVLSVETITVLQLLGFNFKKAIGEPLTDLVSQFIASRAPVEAADVIGSQRLNVELQVAFAELARDEAAFDRFTRLLGRGP